MKFGLGKFQVGVDSSRLELIFSRLELISMKRWISAKRISYVVLDEADHMLSTGGGGHRDVLGVGMVMGLESLKNPNGTLR